MEPSGLKPPPAAPGTAGALLLLNGRQSGTRQPLHGPVTLVGRDAGCELRLNVEEVEPFHCVLAHAAGAVTVRDLGGPRGTFVNGLRVAAAALRDGDLLDIGPFRFRLLLPAAAPAPAPAVVADEGRDALRVQAAAVAAQQAALDEAEARLEDQRRQLLDTAGQYRADRAAWEEETACVRRQLDETAAGLDRQRAELAEQESRLAERGAALDRLRAQLQQKEGELALRAVKDNTARELDSRVLADGLYRLDEDRRRWRQRRDREAAALRGRWVLLVEGERRLARARALLVRDARRWETQQQSLQAELHALNTRIVHERQQLQVLAQARPAAARPDDAALAVQTPAAGRVVDLDRLAGALIDQRAELLEQWERLTRVQEAWQAQHNEAAAALEALARRLARQEEDLDARAEDAAAHEARLRAGQEQLDRGRREVAAAQARLRCDRQAWVAEHERALTDARRLADDARRQLERLGALRRQWGQKRRQEVEALRAERQLLARQRETLDEVGQEVERRALQVEEGRRALAEDALALERHGQAGDGADSDDAVARQIAQLRRRWLAQNEELLRALQQQREAIKKELEDLDGLRRELSVQVERLTQAQAAAREHETALQYREAQLAADRAQLEQERHEDEGRRRQTEVRLAAMEDQAESLARALLPEAEPPPAPLERAA